MTVVPDSELVEGELVERSAVDQAFKEPPLVGEINQVVLSPDCASQVLDLLSLPQGTLTSEQLIQLEQLIRQNADVFALTESELGHTNIVEHHMDTGNHSPAKQPFRRTPFIHQDTIAGMVKSMEKQGVIRPSTSPIVLVPKRGRDSAFLRRLPQVERHH